MPADIEQDRVSAVLARLATVSDPELDESVTELRFITSVEVSAAGAVRVGFRLPTYWCAANFAFLMADDMRRAVAALPWVSDVRVVLGDHMYADTINTGIAASRSFEDSFGDEADGDLDQLRQTFLLKAFQRRQVALLDHLLGAGYGPGLLTALTMEGLRDLAVNAEGTRLVARYLDRRDIAGPASAGAHAFVDLANRPVPPGGLTSHIRALRRVAVNAEFNGALCRGLLAARFDEPQPSDEPTLIDFIRAVPDAARAAGPA